MSAARIGLQRWIVIFKQRTHARLFGGALAGLDYRGSLGSGYSDAVIGALLVAPADINGDWVKPGSLDEDFRPIPVRKLPFPSVIVASTNDPYLSLGRARELAAAWGSRLENVGDLQHVGSECKLESWPEGQRMLEQLIRESLET